MAKKLLVGVLAKKLPGVVVKKLFPVRDLFAAKTGLRSCRNPRPPAAWSLLFSGENKLREIAGSDDGTGDSMPAGDDSPTRSNLGPASIPNWLNMKSSSLLLVTASVLVSFLPCSIVASRAAGENPPIPVDPDRKPGGRCEVYGKGDAMAAEGKGSHAGREGTDVEVVAEKEVEEEPVRRCTRDMNSLGFVWITFGDTA
jgi:hypothetical protein